MQTRKRKTKSPSLTIEQLAKRLTRLEVKIAKLQKRLNHRQSVEHIEELFDDEEIQRRADQQLLDALKIQRKEGRISKAYYRRKRRQLITQKKES
jgi:hypothetical protein